MIRRFPYIALAASSACFLTACAAGNTGAKVGLRVDHVSLPSFATAPAPVILPPSCPADLLADLMPEPPPAGGFPAPETAEASAQVQVYLSWLHQYAAWGREGWTRASSARAYCGSKP